MEPFAVPTSGYGLTLSKLGPPLVAIYLVADAGSVAGGWLSSTLIKRGWAVNAGRKTAMLVCAASVVPIIFVPKITNLRAIEFSEAS
jgi:ACS family hexuronate transporter-like MFS transporter